MFFLSPSTPMRSPHRLLFAFRVVITASAGSALFLSLGYSAESRAKAGEYANGTLVHFNKEALVISEDDFDDNAARNVTYRIDATTDMPEANLESGDPVEVYYAVEGKARVAGLVRKDLNEVNPQEPTVTNEEDDSE